MTLFRAAQNASLNGPAFSPSHSGGEVDVDLAAFRESEKALIQRISDGLDAHKRNGRDRNAVRYAAVLEYLRRPDAYGD